jgi:TPP-dependent indolepyruvate ferredoxin oxidoreductase alpha subunit
MRPVSNCPGCGITKTSYALKEGLRRFNKELKKENEETTRYELIYVADRGCGNLQGYWEYGIVDVILNMGSAMIVGEGIKTACAPHQIVVTASGDGAFNFNLSSFKFSAKRKGAGTIAVIYNNRSIRMTGGQTPLEVDFPKEGGAMGYDVLNVNPFRVDDTAQTFQSMFPRYLQGEKVMVVTENVCVVDLAREARGKGVRLGHYSRTEECLDLRFNAEMERLAREEPEKLADMPPFKCRLCGIQLRCQALLTDNPEMCQSCGACLQFPCPTQSLGFKGIPALDTEVAHLKEA